MAGVFEGDIVLRKTPKSRLKTIPRSSPTTKVRRIASRTRCSGSRGPKIAKMSCFYFCVFWGPERFAFFFIKAETEKREKHVFERTAQNGLFPAPGSSPVLDPLSWPGLGPSLDPGPHNCL